MLAGVGVVAGRVGGGEGTGTCTRQHYILVRGKAWGDFEAFIRPQLPLPAEGATLCALEGAGRSFSASRGVSLTWGVPATGARVGSPSPAPRATISLGNLHPPRAGALSAVPLVILFPA